jgi:hypothetical protein
MNRQSLASRVSNASGLIALSLGTTAIGVHAAQATLVQFYPNQSIDQGVNPTGVVLTYDTSVFTFSSSAAGSGNLTFSGQNGAQVAGYTSKNSGISSYAVGQVIDGSLTYYDAASLTATKNPALPVNASYVGLETTRCPARPSPRRRCRSRLRSHCWRWELWAWRRSAGVARLPEAAIQARRHPARRFRASIGVPHVW